MQKLKLFVGAYWKIRLDKVIMATKSPLLFTKDIIITDLCKTEKKI